MPKLFCGFIIFTAMKALLAVWLLLAGPADSLNILFWNLENFFDWRNDSTSTSDAEFSSFGARHWTRKRFYAKCNAIAKGILWTAGEKGALPDVIGLAEVENAFVLRRLVQSTALSKLDYRIVHFDSPDPRGIDVALLYRNSRMVLKDARPCHLYGADSALMRTRDILMVRVRGPDSTETAFLVNHHPSKYGGTAVSEPRRRLAVERLKQLADTLQEAGITRIVAMGDFNDTPANPVYKRLAPGLVNLGEPLHRRGEGSIKYGGRWELIDLFFVSAPFKEARMEVLYIPFLQVRDKGGAGTKPLRTYSGPRYQGGVSDHCPVWLRAP